MKHFTWLTGICTVLLIVTILAAGCTSSPAASTSGQVPQYTRSTGTSPAEKVTSPQLTPATTPAPGLEQGAQADNGGNDAADSAVANADASIDPYNSTSQSTTMVPDSEDLGDLIP
jgi:hypothetical protein